MIFDILVFLTVFFAGFQFIRYFKFQKNDIQRLKWLWLYHLLFGFYYYFSILEQGGSDSLKYWKGAKDISFQEALFYLFNAKGTMAMYAVNYLPSNMLNFSFFSGTMIYSLIGFVGLVFFYKITVTLVQHNSYFLSLQLFPFLFFLPNLHFWSVAIGKDTLLFFSIGLFCFAILKIKIRIFLMIFSIALAFIIRPHIVLFLALSFGLVYAFNKSTSGKIRFFLIIIFFGMGILLLPIVAEYAKMEELSIESYENFSDRGVSNLSRAHTGSSVDVSSYSLPLKIFTFIYRPTFTDINGIPSIIAAIENLLLLLLTIKILLSKAIQTFRNSPNLLKGLLIFFIIGSIAFSMSLGNLGIMLRMRNMFLPGFLIYILWALSYDNNIKRV